MRKDPPRDERGHGDETHQRGGDTPLTTNQGVVIADNQNSLTSSERGATLLEDFVLREKITHFDHERIPERIVHARGSAAHGYFQPYRSLSNLTRAAFLADPNVKTPVFVRFSTVAGGAGSFDLARDVRGFAVKFYTSEGNFDLVGNNMPVFFIQDAMKFPDLIHSVKIEPDRGFPQAASAHDTFWDFVSLMPESTHMLMWAMSDRAIPRSYRMMEGFGIHTFRFINEHGQENFVKFHWRPTIGSSSVLWDEAVRINGADPDFHRRDLWESIESGQFPEFELGIQVFDQKFADQFEFDVLDSTKLIPEELIALDIVGKLVLDRNPDNFFAETEQVAFHPGHVVPGIDFTNDPLLQGRLFSYLDTQLSRLGGANFHEIPINRPRCPMQNFQRDGLMRMQVPRGRVAYEPNSLDRSGPREDDKRGFHSHPEATSGTKRRLRPESFADHYSQARLFWRSMTAPEQDHIADAFAFELGKVETVAIRERMLGHLLIVDPSLAQRVERRLGMPGRALELEPAKKPVDLPLSPALSLVGKRTPTLSGRAVGVLVGDGCDAGMLKELCNQILHAHARPILVAMEAGGVRDSNGDHVDVQHALEAAPSVFFDAVALLPGDRAEAWSTNAAVQAWIRDAYQHLKVIAFPSAASAVLERAGVERDPATIVTDRPGQIADFIQAAKGDRAWARAKR